MTLVSLGGAQPLDGLSNRASWHIRVSSIVIAWLLAAALVSLVHRQIPAASWLMVHLLMLGAVTNAILIWSRHFSVAVLHLPDDRERRSEVARLVTFNVGAVGVVAGMVAGLPVLIGIGATAAAAAVAWHLIALLRAIKRALPSRFVMLVHAYIAAAAFLVVGIGLGFMLATVEVDDTMHARLLLAHTTTNVLGWVGLPIFATLVTLWPTMLRTRMVDTAEVKARRALPFFVGGVLIAAGGALAGLQLVAVAGIVVYLTGVVLTALPMVQEARQRLPESFAAWSALAGTVWLTVGIVWFGVLIARSDALLHVTSDANTLVAAVLVGGVLQVLVGAMSYLLPAMVGGGPAAVRYRNRKVDGGMAARLIIVNLGLVLSVTPTPSAIRVAASVLVLVGMLWTISRIVVSMRTPARERIEAADAVPARTGIAAHGAGVIGGLTAVALAVAVGIGVDPAAVGIATGGTGANAGAVVPTGERTEVTIHTEGMRFVPDRIEVPVGNELAITVVNGSDDIHDLVLETGQRVSRIRPGEQATLEVGVVGQPIEGWCSVAGHRQMGMVFHIDVIGEPVYAAGAPTDAATDASMDGSMDHGDHAAHGAQTGASLTAADVDLMAEPGPGFRLRDPRLAPVGDETEHHVRLVVTEVLAEVAPGIWQTRWTFGGTSPGPTLHGRIGDTFVVTLVNDGTIGHSIDFHAGALAPDQPMRTIQPGESLEYRFTATRAGIWMYHCSTMPMSMHIANGMFGAVVIDPPDLAPVDHEFVMVQSESYLGPPEGTADADKIAAGDYDLVTFNGYPMQYDRHPLEVGVGERIRIWVLAAGPNVGSAFHVIGSQFDTVYREGSYDLKPSAGGSQVLGLFPAQGGFVEFELPEAGSYPFVTHAMSDAERGAHGILHAAD